MDRYTSSASPPHPTSYPSAQVRANLGLSITFWFTGWWIELYTGPALSADLQEQDYEGLRCLAWMGHRDMADFMDPLVVGGCSSSNRSAFSCKGQHCLSPESLLSMICSEHPVLWKGILMGMPALWRGSQGCFWSLWVPMSSFFFFF